MDWVYALLPMAPADNLEDVCTVNVKGNKTSKLGEQDLKVCNLQLDSTLYYRGNDVQCRQRGAHS